MRVTIIITRLLIGEESITTLDNSKKRNMTSQDKPVIWLINDQRIGNFNQLKAISYYLSHKLDFREYKISFSRTIFLPNIFNLIFSTGVVFEETNYPKPNFILSAGRRSALAAAILKKRYHDTKIIQIMRPNLPAKYFDFIATPKHDNYQFSDIETTLTPNFINKNTIETAKKEWRAEFAKITNPILSVIIGGDTKNNKVSDDSIISLCNSLLKVKSKSECRILLTTSRRTSKRNIDQIKNILGQNATIFLWGNKQKKNPYLAMLAYSHSIIVSADSISMISDSLATGKPTYVYEEDFGDKKHKKFISYLKKQKAIMPSEILFSQGIKNYNNLPINDSEKISNSIMKKFNL